MLLVDATREVVFMDCMIQFRPDISVINIIANKVIFKSCTLKLLNHKSIKITASQVTFQDTTLELPLEHSMKSIVSDGHTESVLKLINVEVLRPYNGTFVSLFPKVDLQNITVDKCLCGDTLKDISCKDTDFKSQHDRSGFAPLYVNCSRLSVRKENQKNIYIQCF